MQMTRLGKNGPEVSAIGLGCMGMSGTYGPADERESLGTIHAALDAGINLLDTGDFYGMGHNEMLLQKALAGRPRDRFFVCVKFGGMRAPNGAFIGNRHAARGGEKFSGVHAEAAGLGLCRSVPAGAGRSVGADRGYGRRDCGNGESRIRAVHRPIRGVVGDDSARG